MKNILKYLFYFVFLLLAKNSFASHLAGNEITYKWVDTLKYEVTMKWYRDCSGISLNSGGILSVRCSSGSIIYDTLALVSIENITPTCLTTTSACSPANTTGTGDGIEVHSYRGIIDFNSSTFSSLASCSGEIIFSGSLNARSSSITTGMSGNLYNYATLRLTSAPINNSPQLSKKPIQILCCQQPVFINMGAIDTVERDSLSYSWAHPMSAFNTIINYTGGHLYQQPFTVYYPGSLSYPYRNVNANPPIGIYLNPTNGDVIFTPTNCNEVTAAVIEVKEWRKDSSGVYQSISSIRQDLQYSVKNCPSNNPPTVNGPYSYAVCEGKELCFNITTNDQVYVPPPPTPIPAPDTVAIEWNHGIPDASFTILNSNQRLQTGQFCWTPPEGAASTLPYQLVVTAKDNACPLNAVSNRGFSVRVKKRAQATTQFQKIDNGEYVVSSLIDSSTFSGSGSYQWVVLDTNRNIIFDTSQAQFKSTGNFISTYLLDTLSLNRNKTYVIRHTINNTPLNCPSTYYDTLQVDSVLECLINYPKDTIVCAGTSIVLSTTTRFATGTPHYQWYMNDTTVLTGDTLSYLKIDTVSRLTKNTYTIQISDSAGYRNRDRIRIRSMDNSDNSFADVYEACLGDSNILELDSAFSSILWNDGSTDSIRTIDQSVNLWVSYSDTFGCAYLDSIDVIFHLLPSPSLFDTQSCIPSVELTSGTFDGYLWSTGQNTESIVVYSNGNYSVLVTDSNGCQKADSATVTIWNAPGVNLGNDTSQCSGTILLTNNIIGSTLWSTGDTSSTLLIDYSGTYSLLAIDVHGCQSVDSILVDIYTTPTQSWADTLRFCSDTGVTISSNNFALYLWSTGDTTQNTNVSSSGFYALYFEDQQGCINTDSLYVLINDVPIINLGNDTAFCGDSLLLALAPGNSYTWGTGDTLNFVNINTSGDYSVTLTDSNGCSASDTVNITLLSNANMPILSKNGDSLHSNLNGTHYWFRDNNTVAGETNNSLLVSQAGNYSAVHIDTNGCVSDTSNTVLMTLGVHIIDNSKITVYPNPTKRKVDINLGDIPLSKLKSIKLYDAQGRLVEASQTLRNNSISLDWTTRAGILWLVVDTESGVYRKEIVYLR